MGLLKFKVFQIPHSVLGEMSGHLEVDKLCLWGFNEVLPCKVVCVHFILLNRFKSGHSKFTTK